MAHMEHALRTVTDRIAAARADNTPLRLRGGGSKDFLGVATGELLDTRSLHGVISYEPTELVVTVGAGTPLVELEALLAEQGQCLAFEPPHFSWSQGQGAGAPVAASTATVGGMVAAGLAGPARASVGGVRDYVLGVKLINGLGQHLTFGGQVMKNVAGYDVSRLMVGARGTLGLLTEISLKVLPVAPAEATLFFALEQHEALEHLHRWGGEPLPLNASCWVMDDSTPNVAPKPSLYVRLRGAVAAVEAAGQKNGDVCYGCHGGRAWYRIAYPYPRHAWEGMAPEIPDWAKARPTESEARFRISSAVAASADPRVNPK